MVERTALVPIGSFGATRGALFTFMEEKSAWLCEEDGPLRLCIPLLKVKHDPVQS